MRLSRHFGGARPFLPIAHRPGGPAFGAAAQPGAQPGGLSPAAAPSIPATGPPTLCRRAYQRVGPLLPSSSTNPFGPRLSCPRQSFRPTTSPPCPSVSSVIRFAGPRLAKELNHETTKNEITNGTETVRRASAGEKEVSPRRFCVRAAWGGRCAVLGFGGAESFVGSHWPTMLASGTRR